MGEYLSASSSSDHEISKHSTEEEPAWDTYGSALEGEVLDDGDDQLDHGFHVRKHNNQEPFSLNKVVNLDNMLPLSSTPTTDIAQLKLQRKTRLSAPRILLPNEVEMATASTPPLRPPGSTSRFKSALKQRSERIRQVFTGQFTPSALDLDDVRPSLRQQPRVNYYEGPE